MLESVALALGRLQHNSLAARSEHSYLGGPSAQRSIARVVELARQLQHVEWQVPPEALPPLDWGAGVRRHLYAPEIQSGSARWARLDVAHV